MDWLKTILPTVASALGSPLAGIAVELIGNALSLPDVTTDSVKKVLTSGQLTGDQMIALRQVEAALKAKEDELGFKFAEIEAKDRDSARNMQINTHSNMPAVLTVFITLGFFAVLGAMFKFPEVKESAPLMIMLGSLGTAWTGACAFWFGTTQGSQSKDRLLANSTPIRG